MAKNVFFVFLGMFALLGCSKKNLTSVLGSDAYFYDDFNRADNAGLGSDWVVYGGNGTASISNQMASFPSTSPYEAFHMYSEELSSEAFAVSTTFNIVGGSEPTAEAFILGNLNTNDVSVANEYVICGLYGSSHILLYSNSGTVQGSVAMNLTAGTSITVTYTNDGSGGLTCSASDGTHSDSITSTTTNTHRFVGFGGLSANTNRLYADEFIAVPYE